MMSKEVKLKFPHAGGKIERDVQSRSNKQIFIKNTLTYLSIHLITVLEGLYQ